MTPALLFWVERVVDNLWEADWVAQRHRSALFGFSNDLSGLNEKCLGSDDYEIQFNWGAFDQW